MTWAARSAIAGTSVTAVAPLPITTTRLSRSRGRRAIAAGGRSRPVKGRLPLNPVCSPRRSGSSRRRRTGRCSCQSPSRPASPTAGRRASTARPRTTTPRRTTRWLKADMASMPCSRAVSRCSCGSRGRRRSPSHPATGGTKAQGEHVRVGADAGIAEQVPRAAARASALEDSKRLTGALGLHVVRGADPGDSGPYDQHVEVFVRAYVATIGEIGPVVCDARPLTGRVRRFRRSPRRPGSAAP